MRPHFLVERDEENRLAAFHEEKAAPPSGEAQSTGAGLL